MLGNRGGEKRKSGRVGGQRNIMKVNFTTIKRGEWKKHYDRAHKKK